MANNNSQSTVSPSLPKSAFTPLELEMLSYCGYSSEPEEEDTLYFYCAEGGSVIDHYSWAQDGFVDFTGDPSFAKYSAAIDPDTEIDHIQVFQDILNKSECAEIPYITIEGAYTCDEMRQGEFGGFAVLITRNDVESMGTGQWLSEVCHKEDLKNDTSILPILPMLRG